MLTYFPRFFSTRAILAYVITLFIVSVLFLSRVLPFQFMLFGIVAVTVFFVGSNRFTGDWQRLYPHAFTKKLFVTALVIRLVYVVFIYFYYIWMTGQPHMFYAADEMFYTSMGRQWRESGFSSLIWQLQTSCDFSDRGYIVWLAFENLLFGTGVLIPRLLKCCIDALTCVLIYNLAKRNFGESTGRMAAIFCMLMPNMWYYCGITLKETEMTFLVVLFVERTDYMLRAPLAKIKNWILPVLVAFVMFTFRTALGSVLILALLATLVFGRDRKLTVGRKIGYGLVFAALLFLVVGAEITQEVQELWAGRVESQETGLEWRSAREGGNSLAKYAGAAVFAPLILTIPFPTMVDIYGQEPQMMLNGANFVKNIMSGFTIFALFLLLFRKEWRRHVLPLAVILGYLAVLAFSNFAHSERFHFPTLPLELMFAAYGISQLKPKHKTWFSVWIVVICIANVAWAWFKLAGRGLA